MNLDSMSVNELSSVAADSRNSVRLRRYASCKRNAVKARLAGNIADALAWEMLCDQVYANLPANERW